LKAGPATNTSGLNFSIMGTIAPTASSTFSLKYESPQTTVATISASSPKRCESASPGPAGPSRSSGLKSAFSSPPTPP